MLALEGTNFSDSEAQWLVLIRVSFFSFSYFLIAVTKYPPSCLRKEGFVLNHSFLTQSIMAGNSLRWELEATVYIGATVRP